MKKYLFLALSAVAVFALNSCKGNDSDKEKEPATDVVITVSPSELNLGVDGVEKLTATWEPASANVTIKWESSDPSVATVSSAGRVTAVSVGTATITASAEGAKSGKCEVTVSNDALYDQFKIADYGIFGDPVKVTAAPYDTIFKWAEDDIDTCSLYFFTLYAWDGDLLYVSGQGWAGAGFVIECPEFPVYMPTHQQYYIGGGGFLIDDLKGGVYPYCSQAGTVDVDNYGKFIKSIVEAEDSEDIDYDAYEKACPGSHFYYVDVDEDYWSMDYGIFFGQIDQLDFIQTRDAMSYEGDIEWYDFLDDDRYYGLKVTVDADGKIASIVEPYDMKTIAKHISYSSAAAAPRHFERRDIKEIISVSPFEGRKLKLDKMYKK